LRKKKTEKLNQDASSKYTWRDEEKLEWLLKKKQKEQKGGSNAHIEDIQKG
jgi:hypothetical protein